MKKIIQNEVLFNTIIACLLVNIVAVIGLVVYVVKDPIKVEPVEVVVEPIPEPDIESGVYDKYAEFTSGFSTLCNSLDAFGIWFRHSYVQGDSVLEDTVAESYYDNTDCMYYSTVNKGSNKVSTWTDCANNTYYSNVNGTGWCNIDINTDYEASQLCSVYVYNKSNLSTINKLFANCNEANLIKAFVDGSLYTLQFDVTQDYMKLYEFAILTVVIDTAATDSDLIICNLKGTLLDNSLGVDEEIYSYVMRPIIDFLEFTPVCDVTVNDYINAFNKEN